MGQCENVNYFRFARFKRSFYKTVWSLLNLHWTKSIDWFNIPYELKIICLKRLSFVHTVAFIYVYQTFAVEMSNVNRNEERCFENILAQKQRSYANSLCRQYLVWDGFIREISLPPTPSPLLCLLATYFFVLCLFSYYDALSTYSPCLSFPTKTSSSDTKKEKEDEK